MLHKTEDFACDKVKNGAADAHQKKRKYACRECPVGSRLIGIAPDDLQNESYKDQHHCIRNICLIGSVRKGK